MKDTAFYDKEGNKYSSKRYPEKDRDYVHFFFKKRLKILLDILERHVSDKRGLSLLEVGCADGVVLRSIARRFPDFEKLVGIDVSENMIAQAIGENDSSKISFFVRGKEDASALYDLIVEVGVVNLTDRHVEYAHALRHLKSDGLYICSLAASTSLRSRLKPDDHKKGFSHLLSYKEYEAELSREFEIIERRAYGLFVPLIWRVLVIARLLQPLEALLVHLVPDLFHEKIYVLKRKSR